MSKQRFGTIWVLIAILQAASMHAFADAETFPVSKEGNMMVNVLDILYAARDRTLRPDFKGKTIEIIGQLMPDNNNNPKGNRFILMRMVTVDEWDIRSMGVKVESSTKPAGAKMSWVKVVGTVDFPVDDSGTIPVIKATKVEPIYPPKKTNLP